MSRKVLASVICTFAFSMVYAQQEPVNPQFQEYRNNVVKELNGEKVLELEQKIQSYEQQKKGVKHDMQVAAIDAQIKRTQKEVAEIRKTSGATEVVTDPKKFSSGVASDLKASKGPNVVGFLAGYSSAGHTAGVIDQVNTMQKAAAQYFRLGEGSSYGLINGASMDGGINQRFEEAVKDGKFTPAVDKANFKSYGAVSVNIGEWGGMMTTNKAVLLADSPAGNYEMKTSASSPSMNPESVADAAKKAKANVHVMLTEGGEIGLKEVLEYLNNSHDSKSKALIHLGIGYDPTNPSKDKGIRGASFLAKYLSQHPEMIGELESKGVKFMVVDEKSGRHYSDIKDYLKSADWKTQLIKFSKANAEIESPEFAKKKQLIAELEDKLKNEADKDKKKQLNNQIGTLKGEVALTENRVNYESLMSKHIGEISKIAGHKNGSGVLEKGVKTSKASVESLRKSGVTVDPVEAARAATKGAK